MNAALDFLANALPWVGIGLFIACFAVRMNAKKDGKKLGAFFNSVCWLPALFFMISAIYRMLTGDRAGGSSWLVLGVIYAIYNFADAGNTGGGDEHRL